MTGEKSGDVIVKRCMAAVSAATGVTMDEMICHRVRGNTRHIAVAKAMVVKLATTRGLMSFTAAAYALGDDHSTYVYGKQKRLKEITRNPNYRRAWKAVCENYEKLQIAA